MPTTQWYRAASQVGKNLPPSKGGCPPGQPFLLLIYRYCLRSHSSIGTPAPPLCRTWTPPPRWVGAERCSAIDPPLIGCAPLPSSLQDDQRHFGSLLREDLYCLSSTDAERDLSANATLSSPSCQHKAIHIAVVVDIAQYCFVSDGVHRSLFGLTSGARRLRRRLPRLGRSPMFSCCASGKPVRRQHHIGCKHIQRCSCVGLRPAARSTSTTLPLPPPR